LLKDKPPSMWKNGSNFDTIFLMYHTTMKFLKHNHPISWIAFYSKIVIYFYSRYNCMSCLQFLWGTSQIFHPFQLFGSKLINISPYPSLLCLLNCPFPLMGHLWPTLIPCQTFLPKIEHVHHPPPEIVHNFVSTLKCQYVTH
jgi:hypothetical protein